MRPRAQRDRRPAGRVLPLHCLAGLCPWHLSARVSGLFYPILSNSILHAARGWHSLTKSGGARLPRSRGSGKISLNTGPVIEIPWRPRPPPPPFFHLGRARAVVGRRALRRNGVCARRAAPRRQRASEHKGGREGTDQRGGGWAMGVRGSRQSTTLPPRFTAGAQKEGGRLHIHTTPRVL
eukprot:scaffold3852_cov402-Prasinococcus_capsulatus_cf.AAC.9